LQWLFHETPQPALTLLLLLLLLLSKTHCHTLSDPYQIIYRILHMWISTLIKQSLLIWQPVLRLNVDVEMSFKTSTYQSNKWRLWKFWFFTLTVNIENDNSDHW